MVAVCCQTASFWTEVETKNNGFAFTNETVILSLRGIFSPCPKIFEGVQAKRRMAALEQATGGRGGNIFQKFPLPAFAFFSISFYLAITCFVLLPRSRPALVTQALVASIRYPSTLK